MAIRTTAALIADDLPDVVTASKGALVFCKATGATYYWNGTAWVTMAGAALPPADITKQQNALKSMTK